MRDTKGERLELKYHPFPFREKNKKEYIIGEALLKWKGISKNEAETLRNVSCDPPDLLFIAEDYGEIRMEVTESVPYDRNSEAKGASFQRMLLKHLKILGTRPPKPSNIFVSRHPFDFPSIKPREVKGIAEKIDKFFKTEGWETKYHITQEIVANPVKITFIPACGTFAYPVEYYDNNLFIHDATGYPLDIGEFEHDLEAIVEKKSRSEAAADILIIFHTTIGIVFSSNEILDKMKKRLTSGLAYQGIYIVEIISSSHDYWVHVVTVREHPFFIKAGANRRQ